jgi:hypothetical protein
MIIGGLSTVVWDLFGAQKVGKIRGRLQQRKLNPERIAEESVAPPSIPLEQTQPASRLQRRGNSKSCRNSADTVTAASNNDSKNRERESQQTAVMDTESHAIPVKWGLLIIAGFFGVNILLPLIDLPAKLTLHQLHLSPSSLLAGS